MSDTDSLPGLVIDESAGSFCDKDTVFSPVNEAGSSYMYVNSGQSPTATPRPGEASGTVTGSTN